MCDPPARMRTVPKVPMHRAKAMTVAASIPLLAMGRETFRNVSAGPYPRLRETNSIRGLM